VLVTRPEYLTELLRNEDKYVKAGNWKKIPWSVLAHLLGDNIISAHGESWRLYSSIMKPGIQRPVSDTAPLLKKSRQFARLLLHEQGLVGKGVGIAVNSFIQRWAVSVVGENFFGTDFEVCPTQLSPNSEGR
jgi:unspecific monooxygenase